MSQSFISLSSGGPVLSPRRRGEMGRCCLGQTSLGHPYPSRTHVRRLATPRRWDHTQNQRLLLPSWLISVLPYHENHSKELQK